MLINITYIESSGIIRVVSAHKSIFSKEFEVDENMYYSLMNNPAQHMIQNNSIVDYVEHEDDLFPVIPTKHILVDISNHPIDNTVTRKAQLSKIPEIDFLNNRVTMQVIIKHYRNESHIPVDMPDKQITFTADNELQREFPEGSGNMIGEYDMLVQAHEEGMKIWDIVEKEVLRNDSIGLLNQKCNYD